LLAAIAAKKEPGVSAGRGSSGFCDPYFPLKVSLMNAADGILNLAGALLALSFLFQLLIAHSLVSLFLEAALKLIPKDKSGLITFVPGDRVL
jgi:hypothetical protein